ncbi:LexA family protein [Halopseudomonas pelagia]|uniref:LexA family protein n=1 Tax=Halopseudomonas pelagia TaxID=553151 RepID=UPI001F33E1C1|nr:S24 family peptidase [Halopseudomonas pelagia]
MIDATTELPFTVLRGEEGRTNSRAVPLIPLQIAAGSFSESQALDTDVDEWVELPDGFSASEDLFVAQVVGESMNRRIPNGAWCLFRANPKGTRQGKIVVAQHRSIDDAETGGSFTVKKYYSEKVAAEGGAGWAHHRITLSPESTDSSFQPIVLGAEEQYEVRVLAELVVVLV